MRSSAAHRCAPLQALVEDALVVLERHVEQQVFALVVAAAADGDGVVVAEQIERRPLLGDADRMVQRQHRDRRSEPDVLRPRRDIRQQSGQESTPSELK